MKILFTGGGTAGHLMPIVATAREIRRLYTKEKILFYYIGPRDDFGSLLLSQEGIKIKTVLAGKVRRYFNPQSFLSNIFDVLFKIPFGIIQAFFLIFFLGPDLIFSKGGYGAVPATISGWILRVPVFLHESDVVPGKANVFLSKFAKEIFVSFPVRLMQKLPLDKLIFVGNPVRKELSEGNFEKAKEYLHVSGEKPVVLILGGSQGSRRINDMILEILPVMISEFEIIHQCGEKNFKQVQTEAKVMITAEKEKYYHLFPFLREKELKEAYGASSIVVSRAGSNAIFEIAYLGKPSIIIPLPESAQDHQSKNAYAYEQNGACIVLEEANLSPRFFLEKLRFLIRRPDEMERMQKAAVEFSTPNSAKIIAEYILANLT